MFYVRVTHILFSSFAFVPSLSALGMSRFGTETGNIIVALLGVPLLPTLLASKAKLLVLEFPLGVVAVKVTVKFELFVKMPQTSRAEHTKLVIYDGSVRGNTLPLFVQCFLGALRSIFTPRLLVSFQEIQFVGHSWSRDDKHKKNTHIEILGNSR